MKRYKKHLIPDSLPPLEWSLEPLTEDESVQVILIHPGARRAVRHFARRAGLSVERRYKRAEATVLSGPAPAVARAFGVRLGTAGQGWRSYAGRVRVPASLKGSVLGVIGLDQAPLPRPIASTTPRAERPYSPQELAERYRFPPGRGAGRRVAVVELDGGFHQEDMRDYFEGLGLDLPSITCIGSNEPAPRDQTAEVVRAFAQQQLPEDLSLLTDQVLWTIETTMDLQLAGALASEAALTAVFAPANSLAGALIALLELLDQAPPPDVISISWSFPEDTLSGMEIRCFDYVLERLAARGVTVCACTGNYGASGTMENTEGERRAVVYPASSASALACGGSTLPRAPEQPQRVWNTRVSDQAAAVHMASGGGFSARIPQPAWQREAAAPYPDKRRGTPDVSADADFSTGVQLLIAGVDYTSSGTSAATAIWAALVARLSEALGTGLGQLAPRLYDPEVSPALQRITRGHSSLIGKPEYWSARSGWSPAAGLGSPDGEALLEALRAQLDGARASSSPQ